MSWITPKHLEDASRVLQGVAIVLARAAADSPALRRVGAADTQQGLRAAADLLQAQAERARLSLAHAAAAAGAAPGSSSAPTAAGAAEWAAAQLGQLGQALGGASVSAVPRNPLVEYAFPETARMFAPHAAASPISAPPLPAGAAAAAAAAAQALQQQLSHAAAALAGAGAGAGAPDAVLRSAQQAVAAQAERLSSAAAAGAAAAAAALRQPAAQQAPAGWGAPAAAGAQAAPAADAAAYAARPAAGEAAATSSSAPAVGEPGPSSAPASARAGVSSGATDSGSEAVGVWFSGHDDAGLVRAAERAMPAAPAAAAPSAAPTAEPAAQAAAPEQRQEQQQQQPQQQQPPRAGFQQEPSRPALRERRVPATPIGRAFGFAQMGASLLLGTLKDNIVGTFSPPKAAAAGGDGSNSGTGGGGGGNSGAFSVMTEANAERLAAALCRMRGAALKLGQMISIQDDTVLPPQIQSALERVRQGADVMPRAQLEKQLRSQLGADWASKLDDFEWAPRAAASIGQVHSAVLKDGRRVAMKIQYPGVARSIESDVDNLMRLIAVANVLPRGLFVENAAKVAKRELKLECDYAYEASAQKRFKALVAGDPQLCGGFFVPGVIDELSAGQVLTSEWVEGYSIDKVRELPQDVRDDVGTRLLRLTLRELFGWRFMQTDPNWGNFLYDPATDTLNLIDFGAARVYPKGFVDDYLRMVRACAERDSDGVVRYSTRLGFLTGDESAVMLDAHTQAGFVVGLPFAAADGAPRGPEGFAPYDFGTHAGMTARVSELGSVMLKHRLTPPPEESYSLHRKLSGAFLACMKLRARVPCRRLFYDAFDAHTWGPAPDEDEAGDGMAAAGTA